MVKETEFLDLLIKWAPMMIIGLDKDCRIILFNKFAEEITGYEANEVIQKEWIDIFIPAEQKEEIAKLWKYVTNNCTIEHLYENFILTKAGQKRLIRFKNSVITTNGNFRMVLSFGEDITEIRQKEIELKENNEMLRFITENMVDVVWICDLNFNIRYISPSVERMIGYSPEERKTKRIEELVEPNSLKRALEVFHQELALEESGKADPNRYISLEIEFYHKNGSSVWTENTMKWVRDESGNITGILGVSRDITERKKAEMALREAEERWKFALEGAGDGVWDWDAQTNRIYYSPQWKKMLGYSEDEIGDTIEEWSSRVHPEDIERVWSEIKRHLKGETPIYLCEHRVRCKDGSYKWILDRGKVMKWSADGKPLRMIGTHTDMSEIRAILEEKKSLQEQLFQAQKLEVVGRLAGGIAHDFNNLLMVIMGNVDLILLKTDPGSYIHKKLQAIKQAAEKGALLINQLLGFARKQNISPVPLDLMEAISSSLKLFGGLVGEDIELEFKAGEGPFIVMLDPTQLTQILTNLLLNSRDAIREANSKGKITIQLQIAQPPSISVEDWTQFKQPEYVLLQVTDNGIGMDKYTMERMFEPFFTTKEVGKGTGLGLATVYGIVKQNGGIINVESERGLGTTLSIYLPRLQNNLNITKNNFESSLIHESKRKSLILLVEDDPIILDTVKDMLLELKYNVLSAATPEEAIKIAKSTKEKIDLVITDLIMPQMNGIALKRKLEEIIPKAKFIFISGYSDEAIKIEDNEKTIPILYKPIDLTELSSTIDLILDKNTVSISI